jgi:hypothetical protein
VRQIVTEIDARRVLKAVMERETRLATEIAKLVRGDLHD